MSAVRKVRSSIWRIEALPGVECMHAHYVRHSFASHFHEGYCLGVIERGALGFRYRGKNLVAPAGSVNLAVPGEVHDGRGADERGWAYRMFYLEPQALARVAAQLTPRSSHRSSTLPHFEPGVLRDPWLASALAALHRDLQTRQAPGSSMPAMEAQTRLLSILAHWIRCHAQTRPASKDPRAEHRAVRRAREIMAEDCAQDISLDSLAAACGLSPYHLARTFAAQVGMPPHAYLLQTRVNRAADRLAGPDSLAVISSEAGFADQSHFTRWFKRMRGVTPGQYRKIVQDR